MRLNLTLMAVLGLGAALTACSTTDKGTTDDTDSDTDPTDTNGPCVSSLSGDPFPALGATDVYYRATFSVTFSQAETTTATFTLTKDSDDSAVALATPTWSEDGKAAFFKSAAPLEPSTAYTWNISYSCNKVLDVNFTTDSTGTPVTSEDFLGNTYGIDIGSAVFVEPAGVGSILETLLAGQEIPPIAVVPYDYDDTANTLGFYGGIGEDNGTNYTQDMCTQTISFGESPADFSDNPYFIIDEPNGISLPAIEGIQINLLSLTLSGAFSPDGSQIVGAEIAGSIDTRDILSLLGDLTTDDSDDAACNLLNQFTSGAVECQDCPSNAPNGAGPYCLSLRLTNIVADDITADFEGGNGLVQVTEGDISENPDCNTAQ